MFPHRRGCRWLSSGIIDNPYHNSPERRSACWRRPRPGRLRICCRSISPAKARIPACAHRQEYELLLEKCSGSKYEAFRDEVFSNMQTVFQDYYDMDYRLFLTKAIGIHADVGTQILIGLYPPKFPPESNGLLQIRFVFKQFQLFRHFDCKIHIAVCSRSSDPVGSHHIFFTGERRFDPL